MAKSSSTLVTAAAAAAAAATATAAAGDSSTTSDILLTGVGMEIDRGFAIDAGSEINCDAVRSQPVDCDTRSITTDTGTEFMIVT